MRPAIKSILFNKTFLLDKYFDVSLAYSFRQLKRNATRCLRVRRSNDSAEMDIGFSNGFIDISTLMSFVGANSGYSSGWYDQSGNNYHLLQSSSSSQTRIVNSGTLEPAVYFDGSMYESILSGKGLKILNNAAGCTAFCVFKPSIVNTQKTFLLMATNANTTRFAISIGGASGKMRISGRRLDGDSLQNMDSQRFTYAANELYQTTATLDTPNATALLYKNGSYDNSASFQTAGNFSATDSSRIEIGATFGTPSYTGYIYEIIFFNKILSANSMINDRISNIEQSQKRYYKI